MIIVRSLLSSLSPERGACGGVCGSRIPLPTNVVVGTKGAVDKCRGKADMKAADTSKQRGPMNHKMSNAARRSLSCGAFLLWCRAGAGDPRVERTAELVIYLRCSSLPLSLRERGGSEVNGYKRKMASGARGLLQRPKQRVLRGIE